MLIDTPVLEILIGFLGYTFQQALAYCLDDNTLLLSTLNILRNLSFDVRTLYILSQNGMGLNYFIFVN